MKKKLLATLIATAVLSTGIIGLTACGGNNNGDDKGDEDKIPDTVVAGVEVDKDGWAKAFETTFAAESYTAKVRSEMSLGMSGTNEDWGEFDMKITDTQEGSVYYDGNEYSKAKCKVVATGVPDDETMQNRYKNQDYEMETYSVKDGETYYDAYYDGSENDAKWVVHTSSSGSNLLDMLDTGFATEAKGESKTVAELYESFTYADGIYTATLYMYDTEATVSGSIKDGYIAGFSMEYLYEEEDEDGKESEGVKYVYNFSDYGKTTVTPSDAAKKAVDDYKASLSAPSAVAGKTYVYDSIMFEYDDSVSDAMKEQVEKSLKPQIEAGYNGSTMAFDNNHGFTITQGQNTVAGTYTENGNVISLAPSTGDTPQAFTLSDNTLTTSVDMGSGVTIKLTYVLQA